MGRSEWHAGMERSTRTHADTHIQYSLTHTVIFRLSHLSAKSAHPHFIKNTHSLSDALLYFIGHCTDWNQLKPFPFTEKYIHHTHTHTHTLITSYFSPTARKCTLTPHCVQEYIGHLIAASTHCSLCNMLQLCGYIALQTEGSPGVTVLSQWTMSTLANASVDSRGQPCESPSLSINFLQYMSISLPYTLSLRVCLPTLPRSLLFLTGAVEWLELGEWRVGCMGVMRVLSHISGSRGM